MTPKDILTNKAFCPLPWAGIYIDASNDVRNCCISRESIGNLKEQPINDILLGDKNVAIKEQMLRGEKPSTCGTCYSLENSKNSLDIVSSRIYYIKELRNVDINTYSSASNFNLQQVDIRWSNLCNHACVYCKPIFSSKWANELKYNIEHPTDDHAQGLRNYVFGNLTKLKNIYLAGGEPLLMKENEEFLTELLKCNPDVSIRVNTNLSKTNTNVLNLLSKFKHVHWTVSVESMGDEFEYMRYGANWDSFLENLLYIRSLPHKITFNMVWCVFNINSIFDTIDYFLSMGFHPNSFILSVLYSPEFLDTRHLPDNMLKSVTEELNKRINEKHGYLLEDGYRNLLSHINSPFTKNLELTLQSIKDIDTRRKLDSTHIFKNLYKELNYGNETI